MSEVINEWQIKPTTPSIIKVIGVGGAGGNAVNYLYNQGIKDVTFAICNTDLQALNDSPIPTKLTLGEGLGAGSNPTIAYDDAVQSKEEIVELLSDGTKMLFIAAGMGGGTGTGASPVIAEVAMSLNILTVAIITIPFSLEGPVKIARALEGVANISRNVDAVLIINNDKIIEMFPEMPFRKARSQSDDIVATAARGIAEIVTLSGDVNVDFRDVEKVMRNSGEAVMNTGIASGENRITKAIDEALNSRLLNRNDIADCKEILLRIYSSEDHEVTMTEIKEVKVYMSQIKEDYELKLGSVIDNSLGEDVKITIIATGIKLNDLPNKYRDQLDKIKQQQQQDGEKVDLTELESIKTDWIKKNYPDIQITPTVITKEEEMTVEKIYSDPDIYNLMNTQSALSRKNN